MIKADLEKSGMIQVTGRSDYIMAEYTILTKVIIHHLIDEYGEEKGFALLAKIGQIATEEAGDFNSHNTIELFNKLNEVFENES